MATKREIELLKKKLEESRKKLEQLKEMQKLELEKQKLLKEIKKYKNPEKFLQKQATKKTIREIGKISATGAKKLWNFLGRLAEYDQGEEIRRRRRSCSRTKRRRG